VAQVLAELDQLRAAAGAKRCLSSTINFIGNKARRQGVMRGARRMAQPVQTSFDFNTEASLNMADDPELMQLMKDAGFVSVCSGHRDPR